VPVETKAVGKEWEPATFEVEAERITQYADAIGAENDVHRDAEAAKKAGFRDVVAPPMFAVVYSAPAMGPAILDPDVAINLPAMVHGGQEFEWGEPVCAGDVITTTAKCNEIYEKDAKGFYVFESISTNQDGAETVRATWTNIVRGV
jgi:acyl dehydratase